MLLIGLLTGCSNNANKQNRSNTNDWNDYSFYINNYKIELPMKFKEFNTLITQNSDYELGNSEKFYNGSGIDNDALNLGETEEFYYLNQYGRQRKWQKVDIS